MTRVNRLLPGLLRRAGRRDAGQSLVEMAIILPILLALVVGIYEFGRAWNVYQVVTNTAREGARVLVTPTGTEDTVRVKVAQSLSRASLDPSLGTVDIVEGVGTGTDSSVTVAYPYQFQFIGPIVARLGDGNGSVPGSITLSSTTVMRTE